LEFWEPPQHLLLDAGKPKYRVSSCPVEYVDVDDGIEEMPECFKCFCCEEEVSRLLQHGNVPWQAGSVSGGKY